MHLKKPYYIRLGTGYIDLYVIHSPMGGKNVETYKAILELKEEGLIRYL